MLSTDINFMTKYILESGGYQLERDEKTKRKIIKFKK